jgi:hypothetical protein
MAKLVISMFERTCENNVNPFEELFLFVSEYNFKYGLNDAKDLAAKGQLNFESFDEAINFITRKYAHDLPKLFLACICYELFCYFYFDRKDSMNKHGLYFSLLSKTDNEFLKMYYLWSQAAYSSFIEIDQNGESHGLYGNLVFLDRNRMLFKGNRYENTRIIKIHPKNDYLNTDGIALYSKNRDILFHHVRKGYYPSEFQIPDTVEYIKDYAFSYCSKLTKIEIPNTVKTIGYYAFSNCIGLKEIIIPDSVLQIGEGAFEKCINLEKIRLSKSLIEINKKTFFDCKKLNDIKIPDSVIIIGEFAFGGCISLINVRLPNSLFIIQQQRAFEGCRNVKFNIEENTYFSTDGDIIFNADKTTLISYPSASGEVTISENIKRIEGYAFSGCSELQKVTIINKSDICDTAFSNCSNLAYNNIIFHEEDKQTKNIIPVILEEVIETKLNSNDELIEIRTGCVYEDEDINLYIQKYEEEYLLTDGYGTYRYMDKNFQLSENDVFKNLKAITDYYGVELVIKEKRFILVIHEITKINIEEKFLRLLYCIGILKDMKIFYV